MANSPLQIILKTQPYERHQLVRSLEEYGRAQDIPPKVLQAVDLALEEHLANILNHAYEDDAVHEIYIRLTRDGSSLEIEVQDDGRPFNPLNAPAVDTSIPLDERPIGGLGVHLIRQFMDELEYRRVDNRNVLSMQKKISPEVV